MYIELHASSAFSFLDGASLPEALIDRAAELGYPALALLDRDGVYGAPRFHIAAKKAGIKAIIGAELTIALSRGLGTGGWGLGKSGSQSRNPAPEPPAPSPRTRVSDFVATGVDRIPRRLSEPVPAGDADETAIAKR